MVVVQLVCKVSEANCEVSVISSPCRAGDNTDHVLDKKIKWLGHSSDKAKCSAHGTKHNVVHTAGSISWWSG